MKNLIIDPEFKISKCGEIKNNKLHDLKTSLNQFFVKKDKSDFDLFLVKSFEIKDQSMDPTLLLLEYEEILEKLISNL
ncbi:MAG: hypothetical protein ACFFDF_18205 [Candidatus Odinarchaeota archaeon]